MSSNMPIPQSSDPIDDADRSHNNNRQIEEESKGEEEEESGFQCAPTVEPKPITNPSVEPSSTYPYFSS